MSSPKMCGARSENLQRARSGLSAVCNGDEIRCDGTDVSDKAERTQPRKEDNYRLCVFNSSSASVERDALSSECPVTSEQCPLPSVSRGSQHRFLSRRVGVKAEKQAWRRRQLTHTLP